MQISKLPLKLEFLSVSTENLDTQRYAVHMTDGLVVKLNGL